MSIIENNGYPQCPCDAEAKKTPDNFLTNSGVRIINGFPVVFEGTTEQCQEWLSCHDSAEMNGDGNLISYELVY